MIVLLHRVYHGLASEHFLHLLILHLNAFCIFDIIFAECDLEHAEAIVK
jgi:hypothetical protein